jgi:hypothetical protein
MSRSNVAQRLALAAEVARIAQPQLAQRRISPHTIRHYLPLLTMSCNPATAPFFRQMREVG